MKTKILASFLILTTVGSLACNTQNSANNSRSTMNHDRMNHGNMNHQNMNHDQMNHSEMKSFPNAANAPYDLQFLDTMIAHHQGAVIMANEVLQKSQKAEIKTLANSIIKAQDAEIKQMRDWQTNWNK